MTMPPPLPPEPRTSGKSAAKIVITILVSVIVIGAVGIFLLIRYITASGITRPFDDKFGDQHLKTTVALVELHKIRYGRYPKSLRDIRFNGDWDQIWLDGMRYVVSPDGTKYCVEVERGWIGKPVLSYPAEFWQGTGYSPDLCTHSQ
jgi:hypothetical protein